MKRYLSIVGAALALVAVVVLGPSAQPAGAARPPKLPELQCGVAPTTDVVLSADLICDTTMVIGGSPSRPGPTIDLGGHSWTSTTGVPFRDVSGVTVENGTIVGSVVADRWLFDSPITLSHVHLTGTISSIYTANVVVDRSEIGGLSVSGFVNVHASLVHGGISVYDSDQSAGFNIVGNRIEGTVTASRSFDFNRVDGTIANNQIRGAAGPGIRLDGATGVISRNTIVGSTGDGIEYRQGRRPVVPSWQTLPNPQLVVTQNILRGNGGMGIDIVQPVAGERAAWVVDGGGNRAKGNALDPQCVQVRCGPPDHRAVPIITWTQVPDLGVGVPVGPAQQTATASVAGTFTYDPPPTGAFLTQGYHTITVHFVPDDQVHYRSTDATTWVMVV